LFQRLPFFKNKNKKLNIGLKRRQADLQYVVQYKLKLRQQSVCGWHYSFALAVENVTNKMKE
jgi:hypothetical protein